MVELKLQVQVHLHVGCYDYVVTAGLLAVSLEVVRDLHSLRPVRGLVFLTSHFVITIP